jgi:hypothetical protein
MSFSKFSLPLLALNGVLLLGGFLFAGFLVSAQTETASAPSNSSSFDNGERWALPMDPPLDEGGGDWLIVPEFTPRLNLQDLKIARERLAKIVEETDRLRNPLKAGQYHFGWEVFEQRIWFAPDSGFVMVHLGTCGHWVSQVAYGRCVVADDRVTLFPESQSRFEGMKGPKQVFIRVQQGKAEFLVPSTRFVTFCRQATYSKVPTWENWFTRENDNAKFSPMRDVVRVPAGYRRFVPKSLRRKVRVIHPAR